MSAVVEAVEGIVNGIDKYVIEPIKNDPLTFVATVAAAAFLGPAAATMFGTNAAIGAGIAAAGANTAAGLVQGESFDEAIKGGAIAGLTTWAGAELSGTGAANPNPPGSAPVVNGISGVADDALASSVKTGVGALDEAAAGASSSAIPKGVFDTPSFVQSGADDVFSQAGGASPVIQSPTGALNAGAQSGDIFSQAGGAAPSVATGAGTSSTLGVAQQSALNDVTGGVYRSAIDDVATSGLDDAALQGALKPTSAPTLAETSADILKSPTMEYGTGDFLAGSGTSPAAAPPLSTWDQALGYGKKALDYGDKAYDWAVKNPAYSIPLALGAATLLGQDKPPAPDGGGNQGQIGSPDFYEPLQQYGMRRTQLNPSDLANYGEVGGEQRFFTPTVYEPIQYADGGSVMPQQDKYGYYTYGQIPQTMGGFARGGLSSLAKPSTFDGRSDDIPAVLSDGEFVIDAETVALLGNGSSDAGANRLEEMRRAVRKQKGGALSQGKISSDAKHPLAYLKSSKKSRG